MDKGIQVGNMVEVLSISAYGDVVEITEEQAVVDYYTAKGNITGTFPITDIRLIGVHKKIIKNKGE